MTNPEAFHGASGDVDARIAAALARLALAGRRALDRHAAAQSLSAIQSLVLDHLDRLGPAQVGELASQLAVTPPTMSDSVAALERKGLAYRKGVTGDARGVEVRLTPQGRRTARDQAGWPGLFRQAVGHLTADEQAVLLQLLLRLIAELIDLGIVRDARMCVTCEYFRPNAHRDGTGPHHCALVNLPLSHEHLRVDCPDHAPVAPEALHARLQVLQERAR